MPHLTPAGAHEPVSPISTTMSEKPDWPGLPTTAGIADEAGKLAAPPNASGVPTVACAEVCTGGLHDGNASGGPCVRFGAAHDA